MRCIVGLSAPVESLPTPPSCVVQLTCWVEVMPSRETLAGLRGGPMWPLWNLARTAFVLRITLTQGTWSCPGLQVYIAENELRAALRKRAWGETEALHDPAMCTCRPERQTYPELHQRNCNQPIKRGAASSSPLLSWDPTWSDGSSFAAPQLCPKRHRPAEKGPEGAHKDDQRTGAPFLGRWTKRG